MMQRSTDNERFLRRCPICRGSYNNQMATCSRCSRKIHFLCGNVENDKDRAWVCPNCQFSLNVQPVAMNQQANPPISHQSTATTATTAITGAATVVLNPNTGHEAGNSLTMEQLIERNLQQLSIAAAVPLAQSSTHAIGSALNRQPSAPNRQLHPNIADRRPHPNIADYQIHPMIANQQLQPNVVDHQPISNNRSQANDRPSEARNQLQALIQNLTMEQENLRRERELIQRQRALLEQLSVIDANQAPPPLPNQYPTQGEQFQPVPGQELLNIEQAQNVDEPRPPSTHPQQFNNYQYQPIPVNERPPVQMVHSTPNNPTAGVRFPSQFIPENPTYSDGPTHAQLAARQTLGKDLPIFYGNPTEWPIFISSYYESSRACGYGHTENLVRLNKCLKGIAHQRVSSLLTRAENVPAILNRLKKFFGNPELIVEEMIQRVRNLPPPRSYKFDTIIAYAVEVENLGVALEDSELNDHRRNPLLLRELLLKLPADMQMMWADYKSTLDNQNNHDIVVFAKWLYNKATNLFDALPNLPQQSETRTQRRFVNHHDDLTVEESHCLCCNGSCNNVANCKEFTTMPLSRRWDCVKELRLCRKCLTQHAFNRPCAEQVKCTFNGCDRKHHPLLHNNKRDPTQNESNNNHSTLETKTLFRYIPMTIKNGDKEVKVHAFLDEGSSITLVNEKVVKRLGIRGENRPLCLTWTDEDVHRQESESEEVCLKIQPRNDHGKSLTIKARTISKLSLPKQTFNYEQMANEFEHLRNLPMESYNDVVPDILIGLDNWHLAVPLKTIEGKRNEPIGLKCRLGWSVITTSTTAKKFTHAHHCHDEQKYSNDELAELIKSFYTTDFLGVRPDSNALSTNDEQRAIQLLNATTKRVKERFEVGLLWRHDDVNLPDSKGMALKRLRCLEASLKFKPNLITEINKQIQEYEEKGYIKKLTINETQQRNSKTWYLPMFVVQNPNKPEKKRLVWDFAAKAHNVSLNDMLLPGPDLTASLLNVLLRFRQGKVAVVGDIKEMFHRVCIKHEDQDAQRFMWRGGDSSKIPDEYKLTVMTFGATCSPSAAQFVKNRNAEEHMNQSPDAHRAIVDNTYVDDWLQSFLTETDAIQIAVKVKEVHSHGGFEMRNWKSNSPAVLQALGETTSTTNIMNLDLERDKSMEKVLGLWWNWKNDTFTYSLRYIKGNKDILTGTKVPTKRELLRVLMSIYDPLGLLSNFLVYLKILQQDLWRSNLGWDDQISAEQFKNFQLWLSLLPLIENLQIPRCYLNDLQNYDDTDIQLQIFSDAGEKAMATAAYFRMKRGDLINCTLIAAKTHVAPLKPLSIPRLELEAAVMGARLSKTIRRAHEIKISRTVYWSDSTTVVIWVQSSELRQYGKFVAFRVAEIQSETESSDWRYIPSEQNPADDATKWDKPPTMQSTDRWYRGPSFLYEDENKWPKRDLKRPTEVELAAVHLEVREDVIEFNDYSTWRKLRKTIAIMFNWRTRAFMTKHKLNGPKIMSPSDYKKAENYIFRKVQKEAYGDTTKLISQHDQLVKSPLYKLSPIIDNEGVMRIKGRIDAAVGVPRSMKQPIILPRKHIVTNLIVRHYHDMMNHIQYDTVVNEIRQRYFIRHVRAVAAEIRKACEYCKVHFPKPVEPEEGPLPAARITPYLRSFTFTGLDCAGPIPVTVKRSTEKRYILIFTCLVTSAIHTEILYKMDTDSCITAIRSFMLIRGQPQEFYSDNGTNFVASEKLLREELKNIDMTKVAAHAAEDNIKWSFNPPASPHMGGKWERQIRSLKRALYAAVPSRNFTDWSLKAALAEATYMVNMRPLTYVGVEDEFSEAITPNHFLIGASSGVKPVGELPEDDNTLMKYQYLRVQQFRNRLWKRWVREYLPDLVRRTKNFQPTTPLCIGDIVVICDENFPANTWPKGRVIEIFPGKDGQVRSAKVRTVHSTYHRPASKLAKLDIITKDSERTLI